MNTRDQNALRLKLSEFASKYDNLNYEVQKAKEILKEIVSDL